MFQSRMRERAEALGAEKKLGVQLSSIQGYLRGDVEPSRRFLSEAARVLGVREAWLICNEGEPTTEKEIARLAAQSPRSQEPDRLAAEEVFTARLPWKWIGATGQAHMWELWGAVVVKLVHALPAEGIPMSEDHAELRRLYRDAAETAVRAVLAGARAVETDIPLHTRAAATYIASVCEGICAILDEESAEWLQAEYEAEEASAVYDDDDGLTDIPPFPDEKEGFR